MDFTDKTTTREFPAASGYSILQELMLSRMSPQDKTLREAILNGKSAETELEKLTSLDHSEDDIPVLFGFMLTTNDLEKLAEKDIQFMKEYIQKQLDEAEASE